MRSEEALLVTVRQRWYALAGSATDRHRLLDALLGRQALIAGVADSALSSLATFAVGIFAARALDPVLLGGYALVFTAFGLAITVPAQLVFTPLEVTAVACTRASRLRFLRRSMPMGIMPALLPALALPLWVVISVPASIPPGPMIALTVTGVASAFISPIQDHLRRMLHIGGASWIAAAVSLVQIIVVVGTIAVLVANHIPPAWGPFGALALANGVSLTFGLLAARRRWNPAALLPDVRLLGIVRSGGWLLSSSLIPTGAAFIASAIVAHQAGPALLGYAEVARLSGQPLLVLATGLSATLGPQIMAAAQGREARPANRIARNFIALILVVGVAYIALVGHDWSWNPLRILLPKAYTIHGLVLATILANLVLGAAFPFRSEVIGAGQEKVLTNIEATGSSLRVLISGGAGVLGAFAIPLGTLAMGVVRLVGCRMTARSYYAKAAR